MMDPVTLLALASAIVPVLKCLIRALARRWALRAAAELTRAAAQLPPDVEVAGGDAEGFGWLVRTAAERGAKR